jgi:hypothetical protein
MGVMLRETVMGKIKIESGNDRVTITQNAGDLKAGIRHGDMSRISAYSGRAGIHTGAHSKTTGRHGKKFGK